ncbi:MAG: acyl-CoA reductase [Bacteroidales bacterium]|jgi:hypothetical protein|nr:hypothetical protein [Bacteroidales bacterium]MCK9447591.1 hypothetical protein [Bacteroidales bacterium]MDD3701492.1 acyl-CoA reductase [Bacteroidales bacterium]MDY0369219.1 acyl-CoA reductase [Bacteroidales bacterium]
MNLSLKQRQQAFIRLREFLSQFIESYPISKETFFNEQENHLAHAIQKAMQNNAWFTEENILLAFDGIVRLLNEQDLTNWLQKYSVGKSDKPLNIGVVMAGNIPVVGFHDFMCVLISGNRFIGKLSSDDPYLLPALFNILVSFEPLVEGLAEFTADPFKKVDAIIATGSNNTSRYFEYYFSRYPHIIRRNRNGLAVFNGDETINDLQQLSVDVFSFFGLGCRNVSMLYLPIGYDPKEMFPGFERYENIISHSKYFNNYLYNKSLLLVNKEAHYDNGFVLLRPHQSLSSPVGVLHYDFYHDTDQLIARLSSQQSEVQCIVSKNGWFKGSDHFGQAQKPSIDVYADQIDTMQFLIELSEYSH